MKKKFICAAVTFSVLFSPTNLLLAQVKLIPEQYRPLIHFTPKTNWMNDPNGMVYSNGIYHLFYQHYPDKPVWGPMHWGHATSTDMIHWKHLPIALYPDSLGMIFSGSAVLDKNNTSGFGKNGKAPLVAIFTHHNEDEARAGRNDFQNQSLAYSNDDGKTWTKYAGNPVIKNPGIIDFRDPKVMWFETGKKWIMTLATKDDVTFYSSPDLKSWIKESEFGKEAGAHGGVWECPDLFSLADNGKQVWVLVVNLNPGGPNKGSATQYFLGDFDGHKFLPYGAETKWLDYGPDEYAGITWSNTGKRKIFLGWMSNWLYANTVPTTSWRSAATIPRELQLKHAGDQLLLASMPVKEMSSVQEIPVVVNNINVAGKITIGGTAITKIPCRINVEIPAKNFSITLLNTDGEEVVIGYDKEQQQYFIDRSKSGKSDFYPAFAAKHTAPRFTNKPTIKLTLVIDVASVELFADDGLTTMTEIFFPNTPYNNIQLAASEKLVVKKLEYIPLKSVLK